MRTAIRSARELYDRLGLTDAYREGIERAETDFPVFVPLEFLARMEHGNLHDPLLRQVLPVREELIEVAGFSRDPVGDRAAEAVPGLLHKYAGRALIVATSACAVHCRYCFRRHYPYAESSLASGGAAVWKHLAADASIHEVLFSGGDPLTLPDRTLSQMVSRCEAIPHVRRLRLHTRVPIMIPQRVTDELLATLRNKRLAVWMVVHVNHVKELDSATLNALDRLIDAGIPVLNQAVLLRGVNDSAEALVALCEKLVDHRVMPYYLSQLDRVAGGAHFEVPEVEGQRILAQVREQLPGYAVPRYVRETAGDPYKVPLEMNG